MKITGSLLKMLSTLADDGTVRYVLPIGDERVDMNRLIGSNISLTYDGVIKCIASGDKIKKSYNQGYSYKSFMTLPGCDICMVRPELCHFDKGSCRDEKWGLEHCFKPHIIYISMTSDVKVGITREAQVPTRWVDQGAAFVLPILRVQDRKTAGEIETQLKQSYKDITNWRKMLKGEFDDDIDLAGVAENIFNDYCDLFDAYQAEEIESEVLTIKYPLDITPPKLSSLSFEKLNNISGTLLGIKGQYLIFEQGVLNIRKHQGYEISFSL